MIALIQRPLTLYECRARLFTAAERVGYHGTKHCADYLVTLVGRAACARAAPQQDHMPRGASAKLRAYD